MKGAVKTLVWPMICVALAATGIAASIDAPANDTTDTATNTDANPYGAIVLRNVFGLSDMPTISPTNKEPDPPPNVTLIGLSTLEKVPEAIVVLKPPQMPGKPPPAEETYIMNQGERRGQLELVRINMKAGTAKIRLNGEESTISMRTNAPAHAPGTVAAAGAAGGVPRPPAYTPPPAAGYTPPTQPGYPSTAQAGYGSNPQGGNNSGASPNSFSPANGNSDGIPDRPVRTDQAPVLSPEEQTLMIEAQRQDAIQRGDSIAIILPPTEMSPPEFQGQDPQQAQNPNNIPGNMLPSTQATPVNQNQIQGGSQIRLPR